MFVVPLKADKIETEDGTQSTVLSYTNFRPSGPAVFVDREVGQPAAAVDLSDIVKLNGKTVTFVEGGKVLKSAGEIKRKIQLPQVGDLVSFKSGGATSTMKVKSLKLHKKGELSKGLLVVGDDEETDQKVSIQLGKITDIKRDIGADVFSQDRFLTIYSDYKGS